MKIELTKFNEVYFQAKLDRSQYYELKKFFSWKAENYKFHPKYRSGLWLGDVCFLDKDYKFPIGLLKLFFEFCEKFSYEPFLNFNKSFGENISEEFLSSFFDVIFKPEGNIYPRDYQQEAVLRAIQNGRGILNLATSSGKSLIIYCLIRYLIAKNKKVLIVVPNISLVEQLFSDFKNDYGWENAFQNICLNYGGKELDAQKPILLTTWQSIYKLPEEFFHDFDALLIDETHQLKAKSISEIASKCVNANFRIGLTGTLPEGDCEKNTIIGYLGPVIHKVMSKELIDKGVISQIKIRNLILNYPEKMRIARANYQKEVDAINSYENRNKALDYVLENVKEKENVLVLVTKIEHLKTIKEYLKNKYPGKKVYDIYGSTDGEAREEIRKRLEKEDDCILVASYGTFSTGSNVKKLHHIVLYSSYKSQIKVLQSIGRGLRKHESKEFVTIWDVVDNMKYTDGRKTYKNWTYLHWEQNRCKYYDEQFFDYNNEFLNI